MLPSLDESSEAQETGALNDGMAHVSVDGGSGGYTQACESSMTALHWQCRVDVVVPFALYLQLVPPLDPLHPSTVCCTRSQLVS